jgi:cobalt-zinc-cadmium efflux system protein
MRIFACTQRTWTGSLALLSDAGHIFMDVFALGLSFAALRMAALPPNDRHSYGFHRFQVLAALINCATLLWIATEICREAWIRLQTSEPVLAGPMLVVAVAGLVVNLIVARAPSFSSLVGIGYTPWQAY